MTANRVKRSSGSSDTAFQRFQKQLKWIDLVIEVRDARAPSSSRHPEADKLFGSKPKLIVLAKEDLADPKTLQIWLERKTKENLTTLPLSLKLNKGKDKLIQLSLKLTAEKRQSMADKGLLPRPTRICVVGMPNVGKSSLINWLIGKKKAAVGNRPGITKGPQWVRVHPQLELLDTPGILPPISFTPEISLKLALLNLLPETSYDPEEVARLGLELIKSVYPNVLRMYELPEESNIPIFEQMAIKRKWLATGGHPDLRRATQMFLKDLRAGSLGRITLDQ